jgi:hypothetical protein
MMPHRVGRDDDEHDEEEDCGGCAGLSHLRRELGKDMDTLRKELDTKHQQNRNDIHALKNDHQKLLLNVFKLELTVKPLLDNGQPGLLTKLTNELAAVRLAQASSDTETKTRRSFEDWLADGLKAGLIALVAALAAHFWK